VSDWPKCCGRSMACTFGDKSDFYFCENCGNSKPRLKANKSLEELKAMVEESIKANTIGPFTIYKILKMIEKIVEILDEK
jgi:hypothetical protein